MADDEPGQAGQEQGQGPGKSLTMPVGVVLQRRPPVSRWAQATWRPVAVLPGAAPVADWKTLRRDGDVVEAHAATLPLTLYRTDVEAYRVALAMSPPSVFVVTRPAPDAPQGLRVHAVTASAYEGQDYADNGEDGVEPVAMPEGLAAWVKAFVDAHFVEEPFVKRQRDRRRVDLTEDGIGDARVRQAADVYRVPAQQKPRP